MVPQTPTQQATPAPPTPDTPGGMFVFRDVDATLHFGRIAEPRHLMGTRGEWLMVSMYVKNIGNGPATYYAAFQRLVDQDGREFPPNTRAIHRYFDANHAFRTVMIINPGEESAVALLFDVPDGTQPMHMVLHELMSSPGVAFSFSNVTDGEPPTPAAEPPTPAANPPAPHPPQMRPTLPPAPQLPRMPFVVIGPPPKHG
jgi:hypothetical protein